MCVGFVDRPFWLGKGSCMSEGSNESFYGFPADVLNTKEIMQCNTIEK